MFLVLLQYVQPFEKVEEFLNEHILFLEMYYKQSKFIFSGRRNPRVGGLILANVRDEVELMNIINQDPFLRNGIAKYEIINFTPTKYDPRFSCFVNEDSNC